MNCSLEKWTGKVAVITGASSGIGAAIATALVKNGLIVVGLARRAEIIEEKSINVMTEKGKLIAVETDLTNEEDILKAFAWIRENLGAIHIFINNAGVIIFKTILQASTEDFKRVLDVNVLGLIICTKEAIKNMIENNIAGRIIQVNSVAGHVVFTGANNFNVYAASKFAVTAFNETIRQELQALKTKINVTSISPGLVATEMTTFNENLPELYADFYQTAPHLTCVDVVGSVIYVLSTPDHVKISELIIQHVEESF